jgi:hypothetical protein|tara:strand:+ start:2653 stop:2940 length:288 start_codon:yes stop_codon:yes gene_type:complete
MNINEDGIGSNYRTLGNEPISHFNDERVTTEIYPTDFGSTAVTITCDELGYNSGLQKFNSEQEANLFAINLSNKLTSILDSKIKEAIIRRLLIVG